MHAGDRIKGFFGRDGFAGAINPGHEDLLAMPENYDCWWSFGPVYRVFIKSSRFPFKCDFDDSCKPCDCQADGGLTPREIWFLHTCSELNCTRRVQRLKEVSDRHSLGARLFSEFNMGAGVRQVLDTFPSKATNKEVSGSDREDRALFGAPEYDLDVIDRKLSGKSWISRPDLSRFHRTS